MRFRLAACVGLAVLLLGCVPHTESQRWTEAEYRATTAAPGSESQVPMPDEGKWQRQSLPHVLRAKRSSAGDKAPAEWTTHWYRFHIDTSRMQGPLAVYIPRVRWPRQQGGLVVFANGHPLDTGAVVWNSPVLLSIPVADVNASGQLEVVAALTAPTTQSAALSAVWIGHWEELRQRYAWREFLQQRIPQITGLSFLLLGGFAFVFWLKRREESAYWLFAALALTNFVRNFHYYLANPATLGDGFWWLTINSLAWMLVLGHLFAFRLHGQSFPRAERAVVASVVAISLVSLLLLWLGVGIEIWGLGSYLVQIGVGLVVPTLSTIAAWRSRSNQAKLLAVALWLNVAFGVHDFLLTNWRITPESVILLPYGALTVLALFLFNIGARYLQAIRSAEELNASLEQRLALRSRELDESHRKLRMIEQEQAIAGERQRLMREMHDGLGSSLMSSLVMVEQGRLDSAQVAGVLREAIDDLKLTIDSLEPMGEDLLTLLGTLRYRLGKRLEAAGIKLEWQVQETPSLPWLNATSALQVLRILQEALTNTLKHAQATMIRVETHADQTTVVITLTDNGSGFDVAAQLRNPVGRGLQNLQRRAATLRGTVELSSEPGRTAVQLRLPRERRERPR